MRRLTILGFALSFGPALGLLGCVTPRVSYREQRYEEERAEARRILDRRLYECGPSTECRARARRDYDLRMAEVERYRM